MPPDQPQPPTAPEEFPQTTPRDLYATSDIRFVMLEIGKLMTKVDALTTTVGKHGDKLDDLGHKVTFVKGALWVIGGVITVIGLMLAWYFSGKLSISYTPGK